MKTLHEMFFPERGRVQATNRNENQWEIKVSFLGYLTILGKDFELPFGATVKQVLAVEVNSSLHTNTGFVTRYDSEDSNPNTLRFIVHHFTILIDRDKLAEYASR